MQVPLGRCGEAGDGNVWSDCGAEWQQASEVKTVVVPPAKDVLHARMDAVSRCSQTMSKTNHQRQSQSQMQVQVPGGQTENCGRKVGADAGSTTETG